MKSSPTIVSSCRFRYSFKVFRDGISLKGNPKGLQANLFETHGQFSHFLMQRMCSTPTLLQSCNYSTRAFEQSIDDSMKSGSSIDLSNEMNVQSNHYHSSSVIASPLLTTADTGSSNSDGALQSNISVSVATPYDVAIQHWVQEMKRMPKTREEWSTLIQSTKLSKPTLYKKLWYQMQRRVGIGKKQREFVQNYLSSFNPKTISRVHRKKILQETNLSLTHLNVLLHRWRHSRKRSRYSMQILYEWIKQNIDLQRLPSQNANNDIGYIPVVENGNRNLNADLEFAMVHISNSMEILKKMTNLSASDINSISRTILLKEYIRPTSVEILQTKIFIHSIQLPLHTLTLPQKREISKKTGIPVSIVSKLISNQSKGRVQRKEKKIFLEIARRYDNINNLDVKTLQKFEAEVITNTGWSQHQFRRQLLSIKDKNGVLSESNKAIIDQTLQSESISPTTLQALKNQTGLSIRQIRNYIHRQKQPKGEIDETVKGVIQNFLREKHALSKKDMENIMTETGINQNQLKYQIRQFSQIEQVKHSQKILDEDIRKQIVKQLGLGRIKVHLHKPTKILEKWLQRHSYKTPNISEMQLLNSLLSLSEEQILGRIHRLQWKRSRVEISEDVKNDIKTLVGIHFPSKIPTQEKLTLQDKFGINDSQFYHLTYRFRQQIRQELESSQKQCPIEIKN